VAAAPPPFLRHRRSYRAVSFWRIDPALEGSSGELRHRVLGRLPADLGYEQIAEFGAVCQRCRRTWWVR
jgi:hypothetical protein